MREIIVDWAVSGAAPANTITYWDDVHPVGSQRSALQAYLTACAPRLAPAASWAIRTEGKEMNAANGELTGFWADPVTRTGLGTGTGATGADATQVIAGWLTTEIVDGRRVQGRSFIPGLIQTSITNGNLNPAAQTVFFNAGTTLIGTALGFSIWHRPKSPALGLLCEVTDAKVPTMLGVQRKRRL